MYWLAGESYLCPHMLIVSVSLPVRKQTQQRRPFAPHAMDHGVCVEAKEFVRRPRGRQYRGDYVVERKGTAVCTSRGYKRENSQRDHSTRHKPRKWEIRTLTCSWGSLQPPWQVCDSACPSPVQFPPSCPCPCKHSSQSETKTIKGNSSTKKKKKFFLRKQQ